MGYDKTPYDILKDVSSLVTEKFPELGINKTNELVRLVFEISKRDKVSPKAVFKKLSSQRFDSLKKVLLQKRYPNSCGKLKKEDIYLPPVRLSTAHQMSLKKRRYYPKEILIEKKVRRSALAKKALLSFPKAKMISIDSFKKYIAENRTSDITTYNNRRDKLFIVKENFDFIKKCPCTKNAIGCQYNILNAGFGCIFDCTYCFLQEYVNVPGLILPANLKDFFRFFKEHYMGQYMRIGTGEFCDSLMLDHITGYAKSLITFFKQYPNVIFELKTKSDNISEFLQCKHGGNIVIGFSVNPIEFSCSNEYFAASIGKRIKAMKKCAKAGFMIAIHFDPVFFEVCWQKRYKELIDMIFEKLSKKDIAWISLGTLRFNPRTKKIIEARFPENKILDQELIIGYDGKLRYPYDIRKTIYKKMIAMLAKKHENLPVYLCMEHHKMWQDLSLKMPAWPRLKG